MDARRKLMFVRQVSELHEQLQPLTQLISTRKEREEDQPCSQRCSFNQLNGNENGDCAVTARFHNTNERLKSSFPTWKSNLDDLSNNQLLLQQIMTYILAFAVI